MKAKQEKILVVLYSHPELYPPTLNAIINLADHFKEVHILYAQNKADEWEWPSNVFRHPSGKQMTTYELMKSSFAKRVRIHLSFLLKFLRVFWSVRPNVLLLYDLYACLFYKQVRRFSFWQKPFLWYHNHDVLEKPTADSARMHKLLYNAEVEVLKNADLFTLPAVERKAFYDFSMMKGKYMTMPNFPSLKVFTDIPDRHITDKAIVYFRGSIARGRGLEQMISLLPLCVDNIPVHFDITGFCYDKTFLDELKQLVAKKHLGEMVEINDRDPVPYKEIPFEGKHAHIGWAFYASESNMDKSMGTASNKFFESCALGLPVLYNGVNEFEEYKNYPWAVPAHMNRESLQQSLQGIVANYDAVSAKARNQFETELNFEKAFNEVMRFYKEHGQTPASVKKNV